jgi:uracil-DNA glycosylase
MIPKPRPQFGHGSVAELAEGLMLLGSYHPSQQNTFTGRLTRAMFRSIFEKAKQILACQGRSISIESCS